jgi:CPA1 family monovalent cation:H+ antiporter
MTPFELISLLVTLTALFGVVSRHVLRLPATIGTMMLALGCSGVLLELGPWVPRLHHAALAVNLQINFNAVVLHGMLAFLLFAGALHLDLEQLARERLPVLLLATVGTAISTGLVAGGLKLILFLVHVPTPWLDCLLFGALISPTDPVAVLEMLQRVYTPAALKAQLAGESLFNDGVGAVFFLSLLESSRTTGGLPSAGHFITNLLFEAGGGIVLGLLLSYATYRLLCIIDDYRMEILLTLALAMGGYALADALHVSMPLEAVTAGLLVNGRARRFAMSKATQGNLDRFWGLVDDVLNGMLFMLLGFQLLTIALPPHRILIGLLTIPMVLLVRLCTVSVIVLPLRWLREYVPGSVLVLTWGGLRGGLSVALALSLPSTVDRNLLLSLTYLIVLVSVIGQGLTMSAVVRRIPNYRADEDEAESVHGNVEAIDPQTAEAQ